MSRRTTVRAVAIAVATALTVAACTGTGDDAAPVPTSAGPAATAPSTSTAATTTAAAPPTTTTAPTVPADGPEPGPVAVPVRSPATARPIYFVIPDRFDNGDPSNDTAGLDGGPLVNGFDPTRRAYHHGGDLAGLTARLDYLAGLGIGAIWISPPFRNRYVQGDGTLEGSGSSYHGYWQIDFDHVDPHLGTDDEMRAFVDAAHALDIDVYFDIVVNHTGDVIRYAEDGSWPYVNMSAQPYVDADGAEFDPSTVAGRADFPELDPSISFPYTPVFADEADARVKSPDWLNDVTVYHNRGNSTFQGESVTFGDFYGLDDLFTEDPRVVDGMIALYGDVVERYGVDGFRIDTMKHVDVAFWAAFAPAIRRRAAELGEPDFFMFGEVVGTDPILQSSYTNVGVPATLDFIVADGLERFVEGGEGALLAQAFDDDDWFTDADNNASMQVTFIGNHDAGRMGYLLATADPGADDARLLARASLAWDLLFLVRGTPVVYYGDEQGFTGDGGDQLARQDMFASRTPEYLDDDLIGTDATTADENFDPEHPLYRRIAALSRLRRDHPAFVTGAQIVLPVEAAPGGSEAGTVFAFSRLDRAERVEYVVVANSDADRPATADVTVLSSDATFAPVPVGDSDGGAATTLTSDADGVLRVDVPPLSTIVLRATEPLPPPDEPPTIRLVRPSAGGEIGTRRYRLEAELGDRRYAEVTFAVSVDGGQPIVVGVDDAAPYRVFWSNDGIPDGASIEVIATVDDGSGQLRADDVAATLGERQ